MIKMVDSSSEATGELYEYHAIDRHSRAPSGENANTPSRAVMMTFPETKTGVPYALSVWLLDQRMDPVLAL